MHNKCMGLYGSLAVFFLADVATKLKITTYQQVAQAFHMNVLHVRV